MTGASGGGGGLLDILAALATDPAAYPQWIEDFHVGMTSDMQAYLDAALAEGSPYAGHTPWDPTNTVNEIDERLITFSDNVLGLNWDGDWLTGATAAELYYETNLEPDITDRVEAFETRQKQQLARAYGRLGGVMAGMNMADAGASPYIMAAAILEEAALRDSADLTAQLELQAMGAKVNFVSHGADIMLNELFILTNLSRDLIATNIEVGRVRSVLERDYINDQIQLAVSDAQYELGLFQYGANLISGLSGAALIPKGPNVIGATISGMATGAVSGATIGMAGGPAGAIIGGVVGATIFGAAGALSSINLSALADVLEGM